MSGNDAVFRIKGVEMPDYYLKYYSDLSEETYTIFEKAAEAKYEKATKKLIAIKPVMDRLVEPSTRMILM